MTSNLARNSFMRPCVGIILFEVTKSERKLFWAVTRIRVVYASHELHVVRVRHCSSDPLRTATLHCLSTTTSRPVKKTREKHGKTNTNINYHQLTHFLQPGEGKMPETSNHIFLNFSKGRNIVITVEPFAYLSNDSHIKFKILYT